MANIKHTIYDTSLDTTLVNLGGKNNNKVQYYARQTKK